MATKAETSRSLDRQQHCNASSASSSFDVGYGFWALLSGTLGAAASCFAKLAFVAASEGYDEPQHADSSSSSCPAVSEWLTCLGWAAGGGQQQQHDQDCTLPQWLACHASTFLLPRLACLVAMIACNAAMVACFVGGLEHAGSIAGTALATAANFIVSAALGYLVWKEHEQGTTASGTYVPGFLMVVAGTVLLVLAQSPTNDGHSDDTTQTTKAPSQDGNKNVPDKKAK